MAASVAMVHASTKSLAQSRFGGLFAVREWFARFREDHLAPRLDALGLLKPCQRTGPNLTLNRLDRCQLLAPNSHDWVHSRQTQHRPKDRGKGRNGQQANGYETGDQPRWL